MGLGLRVLCRAGGVGEGESQFGVNECYRLWLLKKPVFVENPRNLSDFGAKDFFNSHACLQQLTLGRLLR
jgi:hypothetical protein